MQEKRVTSNPGSKPTVTPHWDATKTSNVAAWDQKRRLATAMRLVIERLVPSSAPEKELRTAADALERYAEALKAHPRLKRQPGPAESANAGDVGAFFDQSPLIGLANPLAPPITIGKSGERSAIASVTFGSAYEGPPGALHGGFVAATFDEVLGYVQSLGGRPGFTAKLTINYRKPTPLHKELIIKAELVRMEGRKIFTEGRIYDGDVITADAEGLFISVGHEKVVPLLKMREEYEERIAAELRKDIALGDRSGSLG
jgi:acyl-coenzyme A thioesterase PaaI-like protein